MTLIHSGGPDPDDLDEVCLRGELTVIGRIRSASNATFLCEAHLGELQAHCVYKPIAGEAPLWDFPHGTLASRELGAYLVSDALGWNIVPYTVIRDGPAGRGMLQLWVDQPGDEVGDEPESARQFATRSNRVISAGRPPCPLCDEPLDPEGHICVRTNGYRRGALAGPDDDAEE